VYQEWAKFRDWYVKAHDIYLGVVADEKKFSELVPQNEDT
jgi:hypothetical protein